MVSTAVFYGPLKGSVSKIAHQIIQYFGPSKCDLHWVKECDASDLNPYSHIIFGISTIGRNNWDSDYEDDDWDVFETKFADVNWSGKKVAIYCLGDHVAYPNNFADALGWIYERLQKFDVEIIGFCKTDNYEFTDSEGVYDGKFVGLPLDEDTQPEMTESRLRNWLQNLQEEGF